jgi:RNA polymerase sigma factor (sigma-70 family)
MFHIRKLVRTPAEAEITDAELLRRFVRDRDEASFALLVERHGRLVRSVCRRLLPQEEDVEDAFQATLLVLARRADTIRKQRSVASWLFGVAYRTALKARTTAARRQRYERQAESRPPQGPVSEAALRELQAILDEEVQRLPDKFRAPFVLCCLEGRSKGEASQELGWPEGSVSGRVAKARKLLQRRLGRRGITLSAALCALAVAEGAAAAVGIVALSPALVRAVLTFATGNAVAPGAVSARAVALAESVLRAETAVRLKVALTVALALGLAGGGVGAWWYLAERREAPNPVVPEAQANDDRPAEIAIPAVPVPDAVANRIYSGRVLDADRNPRPGAAVALLGFPWRSIGDRDRGNTARRVLAETRADAEGQFTLSLPPAVATMHFGLVLMASGAGEGPGWDPLPDPESRQGVELRMARSHTLRGRLTDAQGRPAAGVKLRVAGLNRGSPTPKSLPFPEPGEGARDLSGPATTDATGAFEVHGVVAECEVQLLVQDERFAPQWLALKTQAGDQTDAGAVRLDPLRTLEGTIVCKQTGQPLAQVRVRGQSAGKVQGVTHNEAEAFTDAQGRYRLHPFPGASVSLLAYPPDDSPYLIGQEYVEWPDDRPRRADMTLRRGVVLYGRVTEAGSGQPVARATVRFHPRTGDHPILASRRVGETGIAWYRADTCTDADGRFRLAALPGRGHLLVKGPGPNYRHIETTTGMLIFGQPGRSLCYADGLVPLDLADGAEPKEVPVEVQPGTMLKGRVVGPDDQPTAAAVIVCPTYVPSEEFDFKSLPLYANAGRFELPGYDPERKVPLLFCDPVLMQSARVELTGAGEPTVRLAPCRSAVVRFVGADGKPTGGVPIQLEVVIHPPAPFGINDPVRHTGYTVPHSTLAGPRWVQAGPGPGEATFSGLIPGATYLLAVDEGKGMVVKQEFTVKADEDPKLPDVVVRRPAAKPPR